MESFQFVHGSYYPSWRVYRGRKPSSMNLAITTHVFYAFARVHPTGEVYHLDEKADLQLPVDGAQGCLHALTRSRDQQYPHLKIIVSVGGASGSQPFASLAASPEARVAFGRSIREFVDRFSLDGVDMVDWEHPSSPEQGRDYVALIHELRRHLPGPRYQLTSALPAGEWCLRNIDLPAAANILDFINLMCYDFAGSWTELSGHQSQLYAPKHPYNAYAKRSCHAAVTYLRNNGVALRKVVLGVPAYGRSFLGVTDVGQRFSGHAGEGGIFEYHELPRAAATEVVDRELVAAYCLGGDGGFVTYDTPETVAAKTQYVKANQLGGIFYWTGIGDAQPGPKSLLSTSFEILKDGI